MVQSEERYISLLTDFGFKRIFGTKPNKDLLINFLNSLFEGEQVIRDVRYLNSEHVGDVYAERKAIFDVYCENEQGEKFIVEMQNAFQKFFKDRSLFYSNDKLTFKYIEIAKFDKTEDELTTLYDKWLYVLKNLANLDKRPKALKEKIFTKLFAEAEIAKFNPKELREYEDSLKAYRDIKNSLDTAKEQGKAEGIEIGKEQGIEIGKAEGIEIGLRRGLDRLLTSARMMLAKGMNKQDVADLLGLTDEEINQLS